MALPNLYPTLKTEQRRFRAHDHLIIQQIRNQAGTLSKAILEAVMNGIDAGATRIDIKIAARRFSVEDNGCGMQERKVIEEFFEMFGTPHEAGDAKFGRFRIGRGQLFSFAVNRWLTGPFQIDVDFNTRGLDYELTTLPEARQGTLITGDLYETLSAAELPLYRREIAQFVKFVEAEVYLNGDRINTPPSSKTWSSETADAYILRNGDPMLMFYQQGVFVESIGTSETGGGGIIVTRKAVELNTARNQVLRSCRLFKRIMAAFKEESVVKAKTKVLSPDECRFIWRELAADLYPKWEKFRDTRFIADTSGKLYSPNTLMRAASGFQIQPSKKVAFCFAPRFSQVADRLLQAKEALMLDDTILDIIEKTPQEFAAWMSWKFQQRLELRTLKDLQKKINTTFRFLDPKEQTPTETRVLHALMTTQSHLIYALQTILSRDQGIYSRVLRVGISGTADGWTDGKTYIAFNRKFLEKCGTSEKGFQNSIFVLTHELCHHTPDTEDHGHDLEFYKLFHDLLRYHGCDWGVKAYLNYVQLVQKEGKKLPGRLRKSAERREWNDDLEQQISSHEELAVTTK